jgi:hypothetical protein
VSDEIELAAKSVGESVGALAETSGVLGPVRELADWVTSFIHYRRQPALARQVSRAAEKIKGSGLPPAAISDKLLRELLEGGSDEDDETLQERWANLLANAMTEDSAPVRVAFTTILADLEPGEARLLDWMADKADAAKVDDLLDQPMPSWVPPGGRDNLVRLMLLRRVEEQVDTKTLVLHGPPRVAGYTFTELGWEFLRACPDPQTREQVSP